MSREIEKSLIGGLILWPHYYDRVYDEGLRSSLFSSHLCGVLYAAIGRAIEDAVGREHLSLLICGISDVVVIMTDCSTRW